MIGVTVLVTAFTFTSPLNWLGPSTVNEAVVTPAAIPSVIAVSAAARVAASVSIFACN